MADNVIRKACDRCHFQKLSCKRVGDEACERCVRLHAECKSSPSLRYKKQVQQQKSHHQQQPPQQPQQQQQNQQQQQQQQQQQHHHHQQLPQQQQQQQQEQQQKQQQQIQQIQQIQHQHLLLQNQQAHQQHPTPSSQPILSGHPSPRRRRTGSDLNLIQPEAEPISPQAGDFATAHHPVAGPDTALELGDFNFNFEQLAFLTPTQVEPLTVLPGTADQFQNPPPFTEAWEQQLASTSEGFPAPVAPHPFSPSSGSPFHRPVPSLAPKRRSCIGENVGTDRRQRKRPRHRARQIALRHVAHAPMQSREVPTSHWMAQLTDINSRLLDLASILPQHFGAVVNGNGLSTGDGNGFPIDEMFKLTRGVADILDRLSGVGRSKDSKRSDGKDPGNDMFVLSTYVRLLDMYQRVFTLVRHEIAEPDSGVAFRCWKLPDVTVGSFAVESSPWLQMSLTIQLAEEFLIRLRNATAALDPALRSGEPQPVCDGTNGNSTFFDVVDASFYAVRAKEESLLKDLAELRDKIEAFLDG
ncbi:hypothetical protein RJ55_02374 [Drechmeria coniospora]|nr:hypothetical protein RJ55_02374 [Drechmeria coniospora]